MIANLIHDQAMTVQDQAFASAASMVLLLATLAVVYALNRWGSRMTRWSRV